MYPNADACRAGDVQRMTGVFGVHAGGHTDFYRNPLLMYFSGGGERIAAIIAGAGGNPGTVRRAVCAALTDECGSRFACAHHQRIRRQCPCGVGFQRAQLSHGIKGQGVRCGCNEYVSSHKEIAAVLEKCLKRLNFPSWRSGHYFLSEQAGSCFLRACSRSVTSAWKPWRTERRNRSIFDICEDSAPSDAGSRARRKNRAQALRTAI